MHPQIYARTHSAYTGEQKAALVCALLAQSHARIGYIVALIRSGAR